MTTTLKHCDELAIVICITPTMRYLKAAYAIHECAHEHAAALNSEAVACGDNCTYAVDYVPFFTGFPFG